MPSQSAVYATAIDTSISDLFRAKPDVFKNRAILVTCLDSMTDLSGFATWPEYVRDIQFEQVGTNLFISAESSAVFIDLMAVHYDEMWFFDVDAAVARPPLSMKSPRFSSDRADFQEYKPSEDFLDHFRRIGAAFALGDGDWLNLACRDIDLYHRLIE